MSEKNANKRTAFKWAKFILPGTLAAFCVILYIVNSASAGERSGYGYQDTTAAPAYAELTPVSDFMPRAEECGLSGGYTAQGITARDASYTLAHGELQLSLSNGGVSSFTLVCPVPAEGGSLILGDLYGDTAEETRTWLLSAAPALLRALDCASKLDSADGDAFYLALNSTFSDNKSQSLTLGGMECHIASEAAEEGRVLHISASAVDAG